MNELADLATNVARVRARIAAACARVERHPTEVTLIAVTKTIPPERIAEVARLGVRVVGENRVQEARAKFAAVEPGLRWEMIGPLQRNKVRAALEIFDRIQTIESHEIALAIERVAAEREMVVPVLLQVNIGNEEQKHGVALVDAPRLAEEIAALPHVRGEGLMAVAPQVATPEAARPYFAALRALRDRLRTMVGPDWQDLSMGMTDDFEVAIQEGATHVRVGRAIFGERPPATVR